MAELTMLSYKLQDLQFFNKLDAPGQIQLENNFSFIYSLLFIHSERMYILKK